MRVLLALVAGLLTLSVAAPALAAGPYPPPPKGTGRVDPSRISVGECAVFSGDGFAPATAVTVRDNGVVRGTTTTTAQGTFSFRLCYSSDAQKGRHDLAGSGTGADGDPLTVHAVLIVTGVRQSADNPSTQPGGQASSTTGDTRSGTTGGEEGETATTGPEVISGTTGAVQEGTDGGESAPFVEVGTDNDGIRLIGLAIGGVVLALLASLLLLLLARRRRRREDDGDFDPDLLLA